MKTRNGFVSNSSSASFICYWRDLKWQQDDSIEDSVKRLMDDWGDSNTKALIDEIVKQTEPTNSGGTFKTEWWTSMYNDITDVPGEMAYLALALKANSGKGFELIDIVIDSE